MPVGKSFTVEKEKKYIHAIAFKVDDDGLFKLDNSFERLNVKGKRRSDKMRDFINRVYTIIDEHDKLSKESRENSMRLRGHERLQKNYDQLKDEHETLKKKAAKLTKQNETFMKTLTRLGEKGPTVKPPEPHKEPSKVEPITPTQTTPKQSLSKEQPKEIEKPKVGECIRGIKTAQWDIACRNCRTMHRLDYIKCNAPQKPKIPDQLPLKRW